MLITIQSLAELPAAAEAIIAHASNNRIFLFYGDMGAGKTTLIKSLCSALGTSDTVTSPTFAIVNEYQMVNDKIYHFDFYRLKNQTEALDMGYEEYFYAGAWCFIEWPEKIPDLLPLNYTRVSIAALADGSRQIDVENI
ncbi:MAG: tRNA (adenosine(37)-N6)-threonylcarbamoyltransferase complex ATPase subunit type 1 TsaE [Mucilaginibacter sp.]|uniref:tRNA (adenosine(37)-N6)-threonylcarbamoyltransferase complex ATPase subunit type 1 TsaE n=1 Tax=Mucilaginibacter sp. TaxID=1882438 RepID=UPI0031AA4FCD